MKRFIKGIQFLLLIVILASGAAAIADDSTTDTSDAAITEEIQSKLAGDPLLADATISVDTDSGFVTLNGIVKTAEQVTRAEELATAVEGVRQVSSNLKVDSASEATTVNEEIQEDRQDIPAEVSDNQPSDTTPVDPAIVNEDSVITELVKKKMSDDAELSGDQIEVGTKNGVVELNGTVQSQEEADHAIQLVKSVDGVKEVKSNLIVKAS
jgi:hyperosmotically inducible periplasmic protein